MPDPLTASDRPRLFLIDGMALAYRAHFALMRSPLQTAKGQPTSAVFGFLAAIDRIRKQEEPEELVVVFDAQEPTFRHRAYPAYKATREKMPDEMVPQLEWIQRAVEGEGTPFVRIPGFEADDVIGALAVQGAAAGRDVWIVSGDKDMCQLVGEHVRLYNVQKPNQAEVELLGPPEVEVKMGVPPEKVIDLLALMGDTSDNVPGVPGVGPKRAQELIRTWGSLDEVLAHAEEIKQKKLRENLIEHAATARLSRDLVTIDIHAPVKLDDLEKGDRRTDLLRDLYLELEFQARLDDLAREDAGGGDGGLGEIDYVTVDTEEKLDRLVADLEATRETGGFVLDTETTAKDPMRAELVGLSFSWQPRQAFYVPVNLDPPMFGGTSESKLTGQGRLFDRGTGADTKAVLERLGPVLEDPAIAKCGQNIKYDLHVLERAGVRVQGVAFDTMVADWCVDPGGRVHNMDEMAMRRLGIRKVPTTELIGKGKNQITMAEVPIADVAHYACEDADVTLRLQEQLEVELLEKEVSELFHDLEVPLVPVLTRMEHNGILLDTDLLKTISADLGERAERAEARIHDLAGETFNIRSTAVLGRLLFEDLKLHEKLGRKRPKRTAKGTGYATDEQTLKELAPHHQLPALVLEYRSLSKLKSTYVDALPAAVNPDTGRVHTTFHQTGTATGRLSSSDPNLQNIPIRSEEGRAIRRAFVPEEGWAFLSADYSQIELRLLAHLSGDAGLIEAFVDGQDIHRSTAARIFKVEPKDVDSLLRSRAKAVNFGVIYGMGPQRLARETKVTLDEARAFIDQYFETYPGVRAFLDRTVAEARTEGYVTTLLGRKRWLPELSSTDKRVRAMAENVAVNTPMQGTAADLIKIAMIRIDRRLREQGYQARMLLQIHDELVFEVPAAERDDIEGLVKREMSGAMDLDVPILVEAGWGENWSEAH